MPEALIEHDAVHPRLGVRCIFQRAASPQSPVCTVLYDIAGVRVIVYIAVCKPIILIVFFQQDRFEQIFVCAFGSSLSGKNLHFFHLLNAFIGSRRFLFLRSIQTEIRVVDCMDHASARQNFDGDAVASTRNFNDAMVRNRRFTMLISDRTEY